MPPTPRSLLRSAAGALGWFALLALAATTARFAADQLARIAAHESAILALERNAAAMRAVLREHGWLIEAAQENKQ